MKTYGLYLESGPKRRKTMVHVLELPGCVATGPATEEALAATPGAIRGYLRFLARHGEPVDPEGAFDTHVAEHITRGDWLGNGSPYLVFGPDLLPVSPEEMETCLRRFRWVREDLAAWAREQTSSSLAATPAPGGRAAGAVLLHILPGPGGYLANAVGAAPGFSRVQGAVERGEMELPAALLLVATMASDLVRATTPAQRSAIRDRPKNVGTLRKSLRRMLEHDWEHYAELARRPGGPSPGTCGHSSEPRGD